MKRFTSTSFIAIPLILVFFFFPETVRAESIALAGCSQTRSWVGDGGRTGYEDITGENLFTNAGTFGGGSIDKWTDSSSYITDFRNATDGTEKIVLLQVCVVADIGTTYGDLFALIELLKAEVPGVPVYLQPLDVSPQSSPSCNYAGYDESVQLIQEAVTSGIALQGPWMLPLYSAVETVDGCHPNNTGTARMAETIRAWLDDLNLGAEDTLPEIIISAPTKHDTTSITDTTVQVVDDTAISAASVAVDRATTANTSAFNCTQTSGTQVDCTISVDSSGGLTIAATDDEGNTSTVTETGYAIIVPDTLAASLFLLMLAD